MTEAEWLASDDSAAMLRWLIDHGTHTDYGDVRRWPTDRKLRLFACACCRQVWDRLTDERSRRAVNVAEWYADGGSGDTRNCPFIPREEAMMTDHGYLQIVERESMTAWGENDTNNAAGLAYHAASSNLQNAVEQITRPQLLGVDAAKQTALLRDIFGSPFHPVDRIRDICPYTTGEAIGMARRIYEERAWERLPILADYLEENGMRGAALEHLREPGTHVRGCWCVDLILGQE